MRDGLKGTLIVERGASRHLYGLSGRSTQVTATTGGPAIVDAPSTRAAGTASDCPRRNCAGLSAPTPWR